MTAVMSLDVPPPVQPWPLAPPGVALSEGQIHVWCVILDRPEADCRRFEQLLAADELERSRRYHFARDQRRYLVRRGMLRTILGAYEGVEPARLRFRYGPFGKPELAQPWSKVGLHFNLSDCGEVALYAFLRGQEVGVDIERLRPLPDAEQISRRFFSTPENAVFRTVPKFQQVEAFFNCWTRKEAFIKAIGEGMSRPLDSFDVSLVPGEPPAVLTVRGDPGEAARWSLHHLEPCPGHIGALAVPGHAWQLACWRDGMNDPCFQTG